MRSRIPRAFRTLGELEAPAVFLGELSALLVLEAEEKTPNEPMAATSIFFRELDTLLTGFRHRSRSDENDDCLI
ncbi:MAG: hypothetical protein CMI31_02690 [Opitutae bacterium]|nr:hypothetical protein [Opitutae bacterium]